MAAAAPLSSDMQTTLAGRLAAAISEMIVERPWDMNRAVADCETDSVGFDDDVAGVVDDISVVVQPAVHLVGAGAAVEHVVALSAPQDVVALIPVDVVIAGRTSDVIGKPAAAKCLPCHVIPL